MLVSYACLEGWAISPEPHPALCCSNVSLAAKINSQGEQHHKSKRSSSARPAGKLLTSEAKHLCDKALCLKILETRRWPKKPKDIHHENEMQMRWDIKETQDRLERVPPSYRAIQRSPEKPQIKSLPGLSRPRESKSPKRVNQKRGKI